MMAYLTYLWVIKCRVKRLLTRDLSSLLALLLTSSNHRTPLKVRSLTLNLLLTLVLVVEFMTILAQSQSSENLKDSAQALWQRFSRVERVRSLTSSERNRYI